MDKKIPDEQFRQWSGALFKQLRDKTRLTQTELAALAGVDQRYISRLENGLNIPHLDSLLYLLDAMGYEGLTLLTNAGGQGFGYFIVGSPSPRKG